MCGKAPQDHTFVPQAGHGQAEFIAQFLESATTHIPQRDMLEIPPYVLDRIEIGRVARETFQVQPSSGSARQEIPNDLTPMNGRAIPNHQDLAGNLPQQVLKESDHLGAAVAARTDVHQEAAIARQRTDGGQMVARQWHA